MERIVFHIDVNSAYLSWTAVDELSHGGKIDIREVAAIIGGDQKSRRGVVLAKSMKAKAYGIVTGEPVAHAHRKCPNLIMRPPNHQLYDYYSKLLMEYLHTLTPDVEQVSVDECYLDFTGIAHLYSSPTQGANHIKETIKNKFGFTVNVGIAKNKLLAKMASDFAKPDKVHTLYDDEIRSKMWPLKVSELYMAGRASVETLKKLEINTIGDLACMDVSVLEMHLKSHGRTLWEFANGMGTSRVQKEQSEAKGIGNSTTLREDVTDVESANKVLYELAESVGKRLRKAGQKANMISVEIKYHTFQKVSHQRQLTKATDSDGIIYKEACELFADLWDGEPIRLLGIRTSKLMAVSEPEQMSIFDMEETDNTDEKHKKLDKALDTIRNRYGTDAVKRGSLLK